MGCRDISRIMRVRSVREPFNFQNLVMYVIEYARSSNQKNVKRCTMAINTSIANQRTP